MKEVSRNEYLTRLENKRGNRMVKVITGIRRCGKSYLLFTLFRRHLLAQGVDEQHIIALALDDMLNEEYRNPKALYQYVLDRVTDNQMYYILLDEIQLVEGFEAVLNGFLHRDNLDVYVTGSNSRFLSSDIITEFRGRGDEIRVFPFRFADICTLYEEHPQVLLSQYYYYGGMPQVWMTDNTKEREQYLRALFDNVYLSDIIGRYHLRGVEEIGMLTDVLASAVGSLTNTTRLRNTFKSECKSDISQNTIGSYIEYLKDSFLLNEAKRYDIKGRQYIGAQQKYYFIDLGLRNARLQFRQQDDGHLMENMIYNELLSRGMLVDVGIVPVSEKDENQKLIRKQYEVDFVVNSGSRRYYIQSAFEMPTGEKRKQETQSFRKIGDGFKRILIQNAPVVPWHDDDGILTISLTDFLLKPDALDW